VDHLNESHSLPIELAEVMVCTAKNVRRTISQVVITDECLYYLSGDNLELINLENGQLTNSSVTTDSGVESFKVSQSMIVVKCR
jgi:hypothetical protein